ncbi:iron complex transport system permease protein [Lacibacter cauensis]|uniref:Iron complex transport system permease protein n=1 Tax=Lacibacter cauensis TaxID=510947 RepID=A0A562SGL1_9BACT|nr:iron ABC transporter permease [Lacibacter cauensis]TWI80392.1 iron complex transport system permease protein [Lacibacter cauensis]
MFKQNNYIFPLLILLLVVVLICSIAFGAVSILPSEMASAIQHFLNGKGPQGIYESVFLQLRLPRVLLCAITGAVLAVSGVLMQGLFRNPIVEPGLVGTSAGAAFGASLVFVLGVNMSPAIKAMTGPLLVPLFAFAGALLATWIVYALSKHTKHVSIVSLLLVGIAVNAIGLSGTGFMSYIARDPQARSITFWNLGTFSGASWLQVVIVATVAAIIFFIALRYTKELNALLLGEEEAGYLGVDADKLKRRIMLLNTAMVAVVTAFVGVISFMGLIVPHILRLLIGSDNKKLLPASMLLGAALLCLADVLARLLLAPAEIPIGIITSFVGAPVFILLLKKFNLLQQKGGGDA